MPPAFFLDEDVQVVIGDALRARGFDVVHVYDVGRQRLPDEAQLAFAAEQGRVLVTYNRGDFARLTVAYAEAGRPHAGLVLCKRQPLGAIVRGLAALAATLGAEGFRDRTLYL